MDISFLSDFYFVSLVLYKCVRYITRYLELASLHIKYACQSQGLKRPPAQSLTSYDDVYATSAIDSKLKLLHRSQHCSQLLHNLQNWMKNKININIQLTKTDLILGYLINCNYHTPLYTILLVTKPYIFWCSHHEKYLNIKQLQSWIESTYIQQENISKLNEKYEIFTKSWITWKNLF